MKDALESAPLTPAVAPAFTVSIPVFTFPIFKKPDPKLIQKKINIIRGSSLIGQVTCLSSTILSSIYASKSAESGDRSTVIFLTIIAGLSAGCFGALRYYGSRVEKDIAPAYIKNKCEKLLYGC